MTPPQKPVFHHLAQKRCFAGFDAFIDCITRPVAGRENGAARYFQSLEEYADFLAERKGRSFSVELAVPKVKIGGNNPILSDIMSRFGVQIVSAGSYGKSDIDPVFASLAKRCRLISFANPGVCTAYEFSVTKIMHYYNMDPADFTYENLLRYLPEEELTALMDSMDMIMLVNIGEQPAVLNILEALAERIFPRISGEKIFFVDPSDCGRMSPAELDRVLALLRNLGRFGRLILSVNENEFRILSRTLKLPAGVPGEAAGMCREALAVDTLILRTLKQFYAAQAEGLITVDNQVVEAPFCLTGAGDAQNAGVCLGLLEGLSMEQALHCGVWTGYCFIRTGTVSTPE